VNQNPSLADLLEDLTCPRKGIVCDSNYINRLHILKTNIDNNNTGCDNKSGGYKDYTFSQYTDTLFLGDRYSVEITCGGIYNTGNYAALWIDFNNDGDFDDVYEYKGSYFSSTDVITVPNFIIDNNVDFDGPKRLRIRMRHASDFKASESCPTAAENGEVEDYLILVDHHQKLQSTNFITPNDDGQNDYFVIRGMDAPSNQTGVSNDLKIFNRFGEMVYNTTNYANDFKGISGSGETLKNGTYYFVLTQKYKVADEEQEDLLKGFFELKR
jgi:gliding motility-associated-like protein